MHLGRGGGGELVGLLVFLVVVSAPFSTALRRQAVAVQGVLRCGGVPATNARVVLWDDDREQVMDEAIMTTTDGSFKLSGSAMQLMPVDPIFKIFTHCATDETRPPRQIQFQIPHSYITSGAVARRPFDIGVLNLETRFPGEGEGQEEVGAQDEHAEDDY